MIIRVDLVNRLYCLSIELLMDYSGEITCYQHLVGCEIFSNNNYYI